MRLEDPEMFDRCNIIDSADLSPAVTQRFRTNGKVTVRFSVDATGDE